MKSSNRELRNLKEIRIAKAEEREHERPLDSSFGLRSSFPVRSSAFVIPLLALLLAPFAGFAQQYAVPWFKIAGGGGMQSTGGVYTLSGTIGQPDAGRASGGIYRGEGGFWAIAIQQLGFPPLNITKDVGTNYFVSWSTVEPGLILQQTTTLGTPTVWTDTVELVSTNGITNLVQQGIANGVTSRFYRLRRP